MYQIRCDYCDTLLAGNPNAPSVSRFLVSGIPGISSVQPFYYTVKIQREEPNSWESLALCMADMQREMRSIFRRMTKQNAVAIEVRKVKAHG